MKPLVDLLSEIDEIIEKLEDFKEKVRGWLDDEIDNAIWHLNIVRDEIDSTYGDLKREARRGETDPWGGGRSRCLSLADCMSIKH